MNFKSTIKNGQFFVGIESKGKIIRKWRLRRNGDKIYFSAVIGEISFKFGSDEKLSNVMAKIAQNCKF